MAQNSKTPVMVLQELSTKNGFGPPDYQIIFQISGTHNNRFDYKVTVAGIQATGSGPSKQISKHQAAHNALLKLQEIGIYEPSDNPVAAFKVPLRDESNPFVPALNCIVELQNIALENKIPSPEFIEISSVGPAHNKEFTFECKISSITTMATASTKKMAKQIAARDMLEKVKEVLPQLINQDKDLDKKLCDEQTEALIQYQELTETPLPDKSIKIDEMANTLAKLMFLKDLNYGFFKEDLKDPTEENLQKILDKLEVKYILTEFQKSPSLVHLSLKIDTPFTIWGMGNYYEEAKRSALELTFETMNSFMQIQLNN